MTDQEFTVRKRICTAAEGYQFITSGFPNRSRGGRAFESVDGLWAIDLLPGLGPREADMENPNGNRSPRQGIAVDLHVSRVEMDGYRKMWVFGFVGRSRCITEHRPRSVERGEDSTIAEIKNGSVYIEQWQDRDHFPDIAEGSVFPVWVRVERIKEKV
jgi:hypothetical protein